VAIQSSYRTDPYVLRTVASLLHAQTQPEAAPVLAAVLDFGQSEDVRSVLKHAHPQLLLFERPELLEMAPPQLRTLYEEEHHWAKQIRNMKEAWINVQRVDYALSLVFCSRHDCGYCLVLENDALLSADAPSEALTSARFLDEKHPEWGLLRLFRSDFFDGWENIPRDHHILTGITIAGGVIGLAVAHVRNRVRVIWLIFGALWSLGLVILVGKQHLPILGTPNARGVVNATVYGSVSSIAHVYPKHVVSYMIDQLSKACCQGFRKPIDLYIGDVLEAQGASFWELFPNRAEHIGARSSYQGYESHDQKRAWHLRFAQSASFDPNSTPY
jgi:hypothetical protein